MLYSQSYNTINSIAKKNTAEFFSWLTQSIVFQSHEKMEKGTKKSSANLRVKEKSKPISDFQNKQIVIASDTALINAIEKIGILKKKMPSGHISGNINHFLCASWGKNVDF